MSKEKLHCEEVARRILMALSSDETISQLEVTFVANIIFNERFAAVDEHLAEKVPIDDIMAAWGCTKDIVPEVTAERIRPRILRTIAATRKIAKGETLEQVSQALAQFSEEAGNCGMISAAFGGPSIDSAFHFAGRDYLKDASERIGALKDKL